MLKRLEARCHCGGIAFKYGWYRARFNTSCEKFANRLNGRFGIKVELQDERLTTVSARDEIFQRGGYRALNKGKVDGISACLILESWFESYSE